MMAEYYRYPPVIGYEFFPWIPGILQDTFQLHNSISADYNRKDTLYNYLRPMLLEALDRGEISPYEFAVIEDWRIAGMNDHRLTAYGFLGSIGDSSALKTVNENRKEIGMRSVDLRNALLDLEHSTGMSVYITKGWQNGKILVQIKQ
jgi:hypothetical protein